MVLSVQVRRFLLSGVLATAVHFAVALAMIETAHAEPAIANAVAFTVATAFSYVINTLWSFGSSIDGRTLARFVTVQLLGVVLAAAVSGTVDWLGGHYIVGIICVPVFVTPVTYTLHRLWTYRPRVQT
ncbi:MAG TPA: GtrA family protein [Steroidobacter sp.]|uniref:GtrA family protein n=1 Tax=Steroidobacter sp. TaxID=1978227 RepID=UPI002EDB7A62